MISFSEMMKSQELSKMKLHLFIFAGIGSVIKQSVPDEDISDTTEDVNEVRKLVQFTNTYVSPVITKWYKFQFLISSY